MDISNWHKQDKFTEKYKMSFSITSVFKYFQFFFFFFFFLRHSNSLLFCPVISMNIPDQLILKKVFSELNFQKTKLAVCSSCKLLPHPPYIYSIFSIYVYNIYNIDIYIHIYLYFTFIYLYIYYIYYIYYMYIYIYIYMYI